MRTLCLLFLSLVWSCAVAQFKIVPQSTLDSIASPRTAKSAIVVDSKVIDLGRVAESAVAEGCITLRNSGAEAIAYRTRTTCRCLSSGSGVVRGSQSSKVAFRFAGKGFPGPFSHKLFIYADTTENLPVAVVDIKGYVVADADRSVDYPYICGVLLLRQPGVKVESHSTARIACMNSGKQEAVIEKDSLLSSPELEIYTEPRVLKAGEQGDLVIRLNAEKSSNLKLYIKAAVAPRMREIKIE